MENPNFLESTVLYVLPSFFRKHLDAFVEVNNGKFEVGKGYISLENVLHFTYWKGEFCEVTQRTIYPYMYVVNRCNGFVEFESKHGLLFG